jgi:choloylglycine hydrolase
MKKHLSKMFIISICICLVSVTGQPCTTFVLDNGTSTVVGKNFDYHNDIGFLIVNKRGVAKTSMPLSMGPDAEQISWTSKYGSVTFTLLAREMPLAGVNEAGLVIETMMLDKNELPEPDVRLPINGYQWMQYRKRRGQVYILHISGHFSERV